MSSSPPRCRLRTSEVGDDAQRECVAADAGEVFRERIGSSNEVAVAVTWTLEWMALPVHLAATDGIAKRTHFDRVPAQVPRARRMLIETGEHFLYRRSNTTRR